MGDYPYIDKEQLIDGFRRMIGKKKVKRMRARIDVGIDEEMSQKTSYVCRNQPGKMIIEIDYEPIPSVMRTNG